MNAETTSAQKQIRNARTVEVELHVRDANGSPLANTELTVRQTQSRFLFGCNLFLLNQQEASDAQQAYQRRFADLWNFATLPFYWGAYEKEPGRPAEVRLREMAVWCREHRITMKGHPLCWHMIPPAWQSERTIEEMHRLQMDRIEREVRAFRGWIEMWDVVNEAVIMPRFDRVANHMTPLVAQHGTVPILAEAFSRAREANPGAVLLLNDFDHTESYAQLLEKCFDAGVEIDVIGIQSHMHQGYLGSKAIWSVCERFAKFGKPLHWTEATLISGDVKPENDFHTPQKEWPSTPEGEARQADEVAAFYSTLYSHPAVEAITWWDFRDACWLGAPSGLLRRDMSPKPAYKRLMELIKGQWAFKQRTLKTDPTGTATLRGPHGAYELTVQGTMASFRLDKGGRQDITLARRPPSTD